MKLKIYSVYDAAAEAYLQPFFTPTKGLAIRMFTSTVNDPKSQIGMNPEDYTLFELGEYDDSAGKFVQGKMVSVGNALEFVNQEAKQSEIKAVTPF